MGMGGGCLRGLIAMKRFVLCFALIALLSRTAWAEPTPQRALLAISKVDHVLAIVDPKSLKVIARMPIGPDPHEVVASSDGKIAYVSNTGSGKFHELSVLDLVAQKALPSVDTGALLGPHGLNYLGEKVWFTAEGSKALGRYDPATAKIDWILGVGQNRTHILYVTADEKKVYASNVDSGTISIFENLLLPPPIPPIGAPLPGAKPQMGWIQTVIPAGKGSEGFDVSPDGKELWTANAHDASLTIIDTAAKNVITTVDTKTLGISRLKFTPDGKRVLVSSLRTGDLLVYDAVSRKEIKKINLGKGASHILLDPQDDRVFVSCTPDNYIAVVDLKTLTVSGRLDVGGRPDGTDWAIRR